MCVNRSEMLTKIGPGIARGILDHRATPLGPDASARHSIARVKIHTEDYLVNDLPERMLKNARVSFTDRTLYYTRNETRSQISEDERFTDQYDVKTFL